jgi:hypothetical protein
MQTCIFNYLNINLSLFERFAVEKDDGQIDRLLTVASKKQKRNAIQLAKKQIKGRLSDKHLWLSVFTRPVHSSFTRLDRVVCIFFLLYLHMLMDVMWYGLDKKEDLTAGWTIGPVHLTAQSIGIGIIGALLTIPPTLILKILFEKSKRRVNQLEKMEKILNKENHIKIKRFGRHNKEVERKALDEEKEKEKEKKKISLELPWWCKVIAYIGAFVIIGVSVFFIWAYGITLGDATLKLWLATYFTGIFTGFFFHFQL